MKLSLVWNVWNNYEDTQLGSAILAHLNARDAVFSALEMHSQGGYPEPPTAAQLRHLAGHLDVPVAAELVELWEHPKFAGAYRVLNGLFQAYRLGREAGSDFVVVTNGDAWCLDLKKLHRLLETDGIRSCAVGCRIGCATGVVNSWGDFVPFYDDHFIILNVRNCAAHDVFAGGEPRAYRAVFRKWGGIHYMLGALYDELVPPGMLHVYTHLEDAVNHYGERSGLCLLPWQYQPSLGFLHANCAQEPDLHPLRAGMLRHHGLDCVPEVAEYCARHPADAEYGRRGDAVFYRAGAFERLKVWLLAGKVLWPGAIYRLFGLNARKEAEKRLGLPGARCLEYQDSYTGILPLPLASRRRNSL